MTFVASDIVLLPTNSATGSQNVKTMHMLRLSLDGTCKVRVAGVQGVLLMMFLSYKGMSSHVTLRVLMVLMG